MFTASDIENIKIIFKLVKGEGYTLQGAKEKLKIQQIEVDEHKKEEKNTSQKNSEIVDKLNHIKKWLEFLEGEV